MREIPTLSFPSSQRGKGCTAWPDITVPSALTWPCGLVKKTKTKTKTKKKNTVVRQKVSANVV